MSSTDSGYDTGDKDCIPEDPGKVICALVLRDKTASCAYCPPGVARILPGHSKTMSGRRLGPLSLTKL